MDRLFQKSTENTTSQLYDEMNRLVRLYASNFLTHETILPVTDNLKNLDFDLTNQLKNEDLGIGNETWAVISEIEQFHDTKPFFQAVRAFYVSSTKKMLAKFPFGDSLLKDLKIIQPQYTSSFSVDTVTSLAKRFPQISLTNPDSLQQLRDADGQNRPRVGIFWNEVGKIVTFDGQHRFHLLHKLMTGAHVPISNADCESILRKIHTDQRSNLDQSTIISLMAMKFNCDECCFQLDLNGKTQLLKKATKNYVTTRTSEKEGQSSTNT